MSSSSSSSTRSKEAASLEIWQDLTERGLLKMNLESEGFPPLLGKYIADLKRWENNTGSKTSKVKSSHACTNQEDPTHARTNQNPNWVNLVKNKGGAHDGIKLDFILPLIIEKGPQVTVEMEDVEQENIFGWFIHRL